MSDDNPVFLGLISDLFPALDVPRKRELEFEKAVKHSACDLKLQPEESFVLKVVQLDELLYVRHSVFIGRLSPKSISYVVFSPETTILLRLSNTNLCTLHVHISNVSFRV